jgi:hypothetical protein
VTSWPTLNLWADLQATKDAPGSQPADPRTSGGWTNIGAYVNAVTVTRGMSRYDGPVIRYQPSSLSAQLRNDDARFDPFGSSTYPAGVIEPTRGLAFQATWSGTHYKLWRGATDVWTPTYPLNGNAGVVKLDGIDQLTNAGRFDFDNPSGISGSGAGTLAGTIINNALVEAPGVFWSQGWSPINSGVATQGDTGWTGNVLAHVLAAVDTELGELWIDGAGAAVFRLRNAVLNDARSNTSQATFAPGGSLPFASLVVVYDANNVRNTIQAANVGGVVQLATDAVSRGKYGPRSYARTDLIARTDAEAQDWAGLVLALSKDADVRIEQLTIDPQSAPATLFPQVLTRELGDRITVNFTPPGGSLVSRACIIRGITHAIGLNSWRTSWALEDASRYDDFLIWNGGNWDAKLWA